MTLSSSDWLGAVLLISFFMILLTRFRFCRGKSKSLNFICKGEVMKWNKKGRSSQRGNRLIKLYIWESRELKLFTFYNETSSKKNCITRLNVSRELVCPKLIGKFHITAASLTCLESIRDAKFQFHYSELRQFMNNSSPKLLIACERSKFSGSCCAPTPPESELIKSINI